MFSILLSIKSRKVLIVGGGESLAVNSDHMAEALRGRSPSKSDVRSCSKESPPLYWGWIIFESRVRVRVRVQRVDDLYHFTGR